MIFSIDTMVDIKKRLRTEAMNLKMVFSNDKSVDLNKRVRKVTLILTLLFISSIFMPFSYYYWYPEVEPGEYTDEMVEIAYLFETPLLWVSSICFLLLIASFLSLNRYAVSLANAFVLIVTVLVFVLLIMAATWSGSHKRPTLGIGYWLNSSTIVSAVIIGYRWRNEFKATKEGKRNFIFMSLIVICLSIVVLYFLFSNG